MILIFQTHFPSYLSNTLFYKSTVGLARLWDPNLLQGCLRLLDQNRCNIMINIRWVGCANKLSKNIFLMTFEFKACLKQVFVFSNI